MGTAAPASTPRRADAPVAVLAPREPDASAPATRMPMRVLQTSRAPAQLSLVLRPRTAPR